MAARDMFTIGDTMAGGDDGQLGVLTQLAQVLDTREVHRKPGR
ncbi:MAG: hypothetical protein ACLGIJ_12065 [Candidatus Limnocylindria bacterium]